MILLLYIILIILNGLDVYTTSVILSLGGLESNPIQAAAIEEYGTIGMLYVKVPALILLGMVFFATKHHWVPKILVGLNVFYLVVVIHNTILMNYMRVI